MKQDDPPTNGYGNNQCDQVLQNASSPEVVSAIADGFVHEFHFIDGHVVCTTSANRFHIKDVNKYPKPCMDSQTVVYRIITPTGMMGYAVVAMTQDNDE